MVTNGYADAAENAPVHRDCRYDEGFLGAKKKMGMSLPGQEKTAVIQTSWYGKVLTASRLVLKSHPYSLTF